MPKIRLGGLLRPLGLTGLLVVSSLSIVVIASTQMRLADAPSSQYDWNVYAIGADQLAERSLYRAPLILAAEDMPVERFNLPPMAALQALPLRPLPLGVAGVVWQAIGAMAVALAAWVLASLSGVRPSWAASGVFLAVLAVNRGYLHGIEIGNNNLLVLGIIATGFWFYSKRQDRAAGLALGLAVATKLWPALILIGVARHRRQTVLAWAIGLLIVQGLAFLLWLGPEVVPDAISAIRLRGEPNANLIGLSALQETFPWWPPWIGLVVAVLLLLPRVPGEGLLAMGVLAGLMMVPNLWVHYLPTLIFAGLLVVLALVKSGLSLPFVADHDAGQSGKAATRERGGSAERAAGKKVSS